MRDGGESGGLISGVHNQRSQKTLKIAIGVVSTLCVILAISTTYYALKSHKGAGGSGLEPLPKNLIFVLTDGMGPAQVTAGRLAKAKHTGDEAAALIADPILTGHVITRSANSYVTDSAAGATTYATGHRTNNDVVSVSPDGKAQATLFEAAIRAGYKTGIVATTSVTDASPAAFTAHAVYRKLEELIAAQQANKSLDVILGGGRAAFTDRSDGRNLMTEMKDLGYDTFTELSDLVGATLPCVGLFDMGALPFDIDRDPATQPSLLQMASKALDLLSAAADAEGTGFMLFVEASRIDHGGHNNDVMGIVSEVLAWDVTMETLVNFVNGREDTLLISLSDHETGGLTLGSGHVIPKDSGAYSPTGGTQEGNNTGPIASADITLSPIVYQPQFDIVFPYAWFPDLVAGANRTIYYTADVIEGLVKKSNGSTVDYATPISSYLGISDLTTAERQAMQTAITQYQQLQKIPTGQKTPMYGQTIFYALNAIFSSRAGVRFTTFGHTGVDINLYAAGPSAGVFTGVINNYEINARLVDLYGLADQVAAVQSELDTGSVDLGVCPYNDNRCADIPKGYKPV